MSKAVKIIRSHADKLKLVSWIMNAPDLTRVWFAEPKRTTEQSDKMWAMLGEIQAQRPTLHGCKMNADKWKAVFMTAAGQQVTMLPQLDGEGFIPYGHRSSELSVREMSDVIEQMYAYAALEGLTFHDQQEKAVA